MSPQSQPELAGIWRRLAALAYESVLVFAIVFIAGYLFVALVGQSPQGPLRIAFYLYLIAVSGGYFVFCWVRSGQTLAQKSWGIRVAGVNGSLLNWRKAVLRYLLAVASIGSGIGLLWAIVDPQHQFLHDRLAGSRLVIASTSPAK
ncbi:MAG: RDD family protein [Burkholderiales bacterium]|jgi:uncharacterized RDD family membrane protein YckC